MPEVTLKYRIALFLCLTPVTALAAAGGVGEGFGADDWLRKWPVLLLVLGSVMAMTGFLSIKIFRRARAQKEPKE
ncbi:hypothetical protein [Maritimibacter sp. UBA3975]|uniref:hypothetical protein n=1 Tax=Maritimibacter sp. UBA3975 TaxID=1946833 RepID=UPI000C0A8070|nr:hypothetical protein [Maritimibacter sp. UBA3975]MAM63577.1 hypothetical protein [Maritimibacter sp.]